MPALCIEPLVLGVSRWLVVVALIKIMLHGSFQAFSPVIQLSLSLSLSISHINLVLSLSFELHQPVSPS